MSLPQLAGTKQVIVRSWQYGNIPGRWRALLRAGIIAASCAALSMGSSSQGKNKNRKGRKKNKKKAKQNRPLQSWSMVKRGEAIAVQGQLQGIYKRKRTSKRHAPLLQANVPSKTGFFGHKFF